MLLDSYEAFSFVFYHVTLFIFYFDDATKAVSFVVLLLVVCFVLWSGCLRMDVWASPLPHSMLRDSYPLQQGGRPHAVCGAVVLQHMVEHVVLLLDGGHCPACGRYNYFNC